MSWQDRFYQLMAESKYGTINELCKEAGIASSTFGNALKGSHIPKPATMEKIAHVLGTTWQYLLNGDEKQAVPDTQVPVLKADQVQLWIDGKLSIESCEDIINAPFPVKSGSFAWRVDTDDMEPEFNLGSYVIMDNEQNYTVKNRYQRLFVLIGMIIQPGRFGMASMVELAKMYEENSEKKSTPKSKSLPVNYSSVTLCELCKTIHGFQLMSADRRFSSQLDGEKHQILAQARYSITVY